MSLIFSPLSEEVLESPYPPVPKGVFLMLPLGKGITKLEMDMESVVSKVLSRRKFIAIKATTKRGQKDYLEKIIQMIRGCGYGIAIFSENTSASTLANIFFEIALCNLLGKPVILVKTEKADAPSDFVRTEWVTYKTGKHDQLDKEFSESVSSIKELAKHYEKLGDIAMEAEDVDLELAYERYRQSFLITNKTSTKNKISNILTILKSPDEPSAILKPVRTRLRKSITEFYKLLP